MRGQRFDIIFKKRAAVGFIAMVTHGGDIAAGHQELAVAVDFVFGHQATESLEQFRREMVAGDLGSGSGAVSQNVYNSAAALDMMID